VIHCSEHFQPLLNLMRESLLDSRIIHCDETRVQVLKEPGREPSSQSWMWVQTGGPPNRPVILFDYATSRAQEVPVRLLDGYRGYVMTDDYAVTTRWLHTTDWSDWAAGRTRAASSSKRRKYSPRAKQDALTSHWTWSISSMTSSAT
jgi:hypothetical protein